jgi:hypothetical protein
MFSSPIAALMAAESARRALTAPVREVPARHPRRAAALILQRVAHRLDPYVAGAPQASVGR